VTRVARKFVSFDEAEAADRAYYRSLTPAERIQIMLDLVYPEGSDAVNARLERVFQIVELEHVETRSQK
jgi:hypothetical protein